MSEYIYIFHRVAVKLDFSEIYREEANGIKNIKYLPNLQKALTGAIRHNIFIFFTWRQ